MAKVIGVMGESGSGKTTSMRNLNPQTTYYFDCDKKGLSWRGWKKQYNKENKNYKCVDDKDKVLSILAGINEKSPNIKVVVIDTMNGIMVADEMRRMKEKGYDKWADLAFSVYSIIDFALRMRDDLIVVLVFHSQTVRDDSGYMFTSIKTNGQKLNKIGLETKLPILLHAKCIDGEYVFETHNECSTSKAPLGLFDKKTIPNDLNEVIKAVEEYENG